MDFEACDKIWGVDHELRLYFSYKRIRTSL